MEEDVPNIGQGKGASDCIDLGVDGFSGKHRGQ